jgi:hypothetical protein
VFSEAITNATEMLGRKLQENKALSDRAHTILGRLTRARAKAARNFWGRTEALFETRVGGGALGGDNSIMKGGAEVLFTNSAWLGLWMDGFYRKAQYVVKTEIKNAERTISTTAQRNQMLASAGVGFRLSTPSDHTFFVYPRFEMGGVQWNLSQSLPGLSEKSETITAQTNSGFGASVGYESPEKNPVRVKLRLLAAGLTESVTQSFEAELSFYMRDIEPFYSVASVMGAKRSEIMVFGFALQDSVSVNPGSSDVFQSFGVKPLAFGLGCGLRWMWL